MRDVCASSWGTAVAFADQPAKVMATSDEMTRSDERADERDGSCHGVEAGRGHFIALLRSGGRWACRRSAT